MSELFEVVDFRNDIVMVIAPPPKKKPCSSEFFSILPVIQENLQSEKISYFEIKVKGL